MKTAQFKRVICSPSAFACRGFTKALAVDISWKFSVSSIQILHLFSLNAKLKELVKTCRLDDARKMFDEMPQRDEVSWSTVISGYINVADYPEALDLFSKMWFDPTLRIDRFLLSLALKASAFSNNEGCGEMLHCVSVKTGLVNSVFVGSSLLDMYMKIGRISEARVVFDEMPERNVVSWTAVITGLVKAGYCKDGLMYFAEMVKSEVKRDSYVYAIALKACADSYDLQHGREIHTLTMKEGLDGITFVANTLATMYNKCGKLDYGLSLFRKMRNPDVVSWTSIIMTYVQMGKVGIASHEFVGMIESGVKPNEYTFAAIISGCSSITWGEQLHSQVARAGMQQAISVSNSLITMYYKSGNLNSAFMVFDSMEKRDIISWSTIIGGYCQGGCAEEAFQLLARMRREGPKPTELALASVLSACGSMAILEQGWQLHAYVLTIGLEHQSSIQSALINMYSKCGSIQESLKIFNSARDKDIVLWTAMINGYAEHGHCQAAIDLFDLIPKAGLTPDSITFIGILTACSHAGLVDLGYSYFDSMRSSYHIEPSKEHYGCMVDLLCRAGRLNEAEKMINSMSIKQDDVVWSILLRACKIHGDVDRGQYAAEKILELNPVCAGTHVTLANIYFCTGKWREAARIRKKMRTAGVLKEPGSSWIKVNDHVSAFVSGDRSHPEGVSIYGILDLLAMEADMVSQDMDAILSCEHI